MMVIANLLVYAFYTYLLVGIAFGLWFVVVGVKRVDEGMHHVGWSVRALLLPGSMALWPLLLRKYLKSK